jgi:hypothetical protein
MAAGLPARADLFRLELESCPGESYSPHAKLSNHSTHDDKVLKQSVRAALKDTCSWLISSDERLPLLSRMRVHACVVEVLPAVTRAE